MLMSPADLQVAREREHSQKLAEALVAEAEARGVADLLVKLQRSGFGNKWVLQSSAA